MKTKKYTKTDYAVSAACVLIGFVITILIFDSSLNADFKRFFTYASSAAGVAAFIYSHYDHFIKPNLNEDN